MILEDGSVITPIHFLIRGTKGVMLQVGRGLAVGVPEWKVACMQDATALHSIPTRDFPYQRSEDPRAVTCPLCKLNDQFEKRLHEELTNAFKVKR